MATLANLWRANTPGMICPAANSINWTGDTIKCALYTSTWTPTLDTATGYSNTNEVGTANGYTQGGVAVASKTNTYTAASAYSQQWAANTAANVGDIVRPTTGNGHVYMCVSAGATGATQPTWTTTRGATQPTDGGVTWVEAGLGVIALSCAAPSWTVTGAIAFRYAVFYDATATSPVANPYIVVVDFGTSQTGPSTGTLSFPVDANGVIVLPVY